MKTPKDTHHHVGKTESFVEIPGFSGYYADRFNDVLSFQMSQGKVIRPWGATCGSGARIDKFNLFDDAGKRYQVSRHKILIKTYGVAYVANLEAPLYGKEVTNSIKKYGKEEFERREKMRENRVAILAEEAKAQKVRDKRVAIEEEEMLKEIHKDDFSGPEAPLLSMDPFFRKLVLAARQRKASKEQNLGEMF